MNGLHSLHVDYSLKVMKKKPLSDLRPLSLMSDDNLTRSEAENADDTINEFIEAENNKWPLKLKDTVLVYSLKNGAF